MANDFGTEFIFTGWHFEPLKGELKLNYSNSEFGEFIEVLKFPKPNIERYQQLKTQVNDAIDCLYWMAGVSYYKTSLAQKISFQQTDARLGPNQHQAAWLTQTWQHGLAELAFENQLPWLEHIDFSAASGSKISHAKEIGLSQRSLVAIGGGKDSLVSIEAIKSMDEVASLFVVGQSDFIQSVAEQTNLPLLRIGRQVDAKLTKINASGAFNGHVPVTAINACVAVVAALLYDFDSVVFSNERSADSGNVKLDNGQWVNHQYSKSLAYERLWQNIIEQQIATDLHCFSLLRPFSELAIVKKFSALDQYFPYFSSCNRNFHLAGSQNKDNQHWCGQCPKCAFVFLCLAPFLSKTELINIFSQDLLMNDDLNDLFESLLGIKGYKPFECVGEQHECQLALQLLSVHSDWQQHSSIVEWCHQIPDVISVQYSEIFSASDIHMIPNKRNFLQVLKDAT